MRHDRIEIQTGHWNTQLDRLVNAYLDLGNDMGEPAGVKGLTRTHTHSFTRTHHVGTGFAVGNRSATQDVTHPGFTHGYGIA
jgi:hypothetical protein